MAQLTVKINGYAYTIGCADGQETHLQAMVQEVENRVTQMKGLGTQSGEARLLVQAALMMADELHDLKAEMAALKKGRAVSAEDKKLQARLSKLAARAEQVATELERH